MNESLSWRTSTYSADQGACIEAASSGWRKSSRSYSEGHCLEARGGVQVRDSKDPDGPWLEFPPATWAAFTAALKDAPGQS